MIVNILILTTNPFNALKKNFRKYYFYLLINFKYELIIIIINNIHSLWFNKIIIKIESELWVRGCGFTVDCIQWFQALILLLL